MLSRADLLCMKHAAKARKAWDRIFKHEKIGGWLQIGANGTSCREMCSFLFEFTFYTQITSLILGHKRNFIKWFWG